MHGGKIILNQAYACSAMSLIAWPAATWLLKPSEGRQSWVKNKSHPLKVAFEMGGIYYV
jgi:hypothetical protein